MLHYVMVVIVIESRSQFFPARRDIVFSGKVWFLCFISKRM